MRSKTDSLLLDRSPKYKNILEWVKVLSVPERKKLIAEIQVDNYFNELDECEVVNNNE